MSNSYDNLRRESVQVDVGGVSVGGNSPVVVQSMTNTDTADAIGTVRQIQKLAAAGSELVRITVNNDAAAKQVPKISDMLESTGTSVPLIGDFHYNGHELLSKYPDCAKALAKYRINPGNVGFGRKKDAQFSTMIDIAIKYDKPIRIGVNWGSLDPALMARLMDENAKIKEPKSSREIMHDALILSAKSSANRAVELGLKEEKIIISCKVSEVQDLIQVYDRLARECKFPLHLGLTEAGIGSKGIVASCASLAVLLQRGIGDTIRISLTPEPGGDRAQEVIVAQELLQTMGIRSFTPLVTACPGCGRTTSTVFQSLASEIQTYIREEMPKWRETYPGVEEMTLAVMGCVVNGPGESKFVDVGISLPGTGEAPSAPVYVEGKKYCTLKGKNIAGEFKQILIDYVHDRFNKNNN